jgi:hypothetical protein
VSSQSDGSVASVLTVARPILQLGGKLHEEATAKSRAGDRQVAAEASLVTWAGDS